MTSSELPVASPATGPRTGRLKQLARRQPVIDVYHGEMRFKMDAQVQEAVRDTTRKLLEEDACLLEPDGSPFDKSQPNLLRRLAADRLYARWRKAGLAVSADDVLVCPYSSLTMLEAVMASVARPGGVILCPVGFYKSNRQHIEKLGLSIRLFPASPDRDGKIDPWHLRHAIQAHREQLCALLFTMPGNPLIATYSAEELQAIGRVIVEEDVRVIVDATLDAVVPDYVPLAAITVDSEGKPQSLYDRTVTITGLSKGHHAVGPYKIGAAITGDAGWRADIRRQLAVPLQRETTALARVVLEQTPEDFFERNREAMDHAQEEARLLCKKLEGRFGFPAVDTGRVTSPRPLPADSPSGQSPAASRRQGRLAAGRVPARRGRLGDGSRPAHGLSRTGRPHQRGRTPDRGGKEPSPPARRLRSPGGPGTGSSRRRTDLSRPPGRHRRAFLRRPPGPSRCGTTPGWREDHRAQGESARREPGRVDA